MIQRYLWLVTLAALGLHSLADAFRDAAKGFTAFVAAEIFFFLLFAGLFIAHWRFRCQVCGDVTADMSWCPCGKHICEECTDRMVYSDQEVCNPCGNAIRKGWRECPKHEFKQPYENEDGDIIEECVYCEYPRIIPAESTASATPSER